MAKNINKRTEYSNINETWDENEKRRASGAAPRSDNDTAESTTADNDLQKVIHEEAAEYDNANKEERVLGGERASVNDESDE